MSEPITPYLDVEPDPFRQQRIRNLRQHHANEVALALRSVRQTMHAESLGAGFLRDVIDTAVSISKS